jgi:2,3-bisphosphoglycerate-dependent phosphoglycerate mutase
MTTLLLVRHGETDWNAAGRLQGHTDQPLNDFGRRQAAALGDQLADDGVAAIYTSDLARARETAEIIASRLQLPVIADPALRERNWGTWEGLTPSERAAVAFEGETREAHRERILTAVKRIAALHPGERVLLVTHGGSMRRIQAAVLGVALPVVANCEVWGCVHQEGTWRPID